MTNTSMSKRIAIFLMLAMWATVPVLAQSDSTSPTLMSLVEAERSFARTSVEKGVRASFLEYFAPTCVSFAPDPGNARSRLLSRPVPAQRPTTVLNWFPIYADISQAGDMGYTVGPSTFIDQGLNPRSPYYGYYFSVWKKQNDGTWKVVLDIGTETPNASALPRPEFQPAPAISLKLKSNYNPADGWLEVLTKEREFSRLASGKGILAAYAKYRAADLRLHRDGHFPLVGADAIDSYLGSLPTIATSKPVFAEVARSGDLGYVYGGYALKTPAGVTVERGYFTRVWRRNAKGEWKLAADIANVIPAAK